MSIFHHNLQALENVDFLLANKLSNFHQNEIFEIFIPENEDIKNLNLIDTRDTTPLYETSPSTETTNSLQKLKRYDFYPMLYFFGMGNGYLYKKLLENPKHQSIMIIEPELELLYITLNFIDFSQEILENRVIIKHSDMIDQNYCFALLNTRSKFFLKVFDLHIHSKYYDKFQDEIISVTNAFVGAFKHHAYSMGNSGIDSIIGLEHTLKNIPSMIKKPSLKELIAKGANSKTAIIVSTGPSLAKQLPLLKKIQEYVTILSIDASFPILSKEGIKPDIVFSIERVEATGEFYKKTDKKYHKDVIFALASVVHDATIKNIHGNIHFFLRNDSYNHFFELSPWLHLSGGMSAANFVYDFASKANFEEIVIIGQDLAYGKDGSSHSKNHVFGENEVKKDHVYCDVTAYGGEGKVPTTRVWKSFLDSYELQIELSKIKTINATEGGARIEGSIEKSFQSVCDSILQTAEKKSPILTQPLSNDEIENIQNTYHDRLNDAISLGKKIQKRAAKAYDKATLFLEKIEAYSEEEISQKLSFKELELYVDNITKIKEYTNKKAFMQMYALLLKAYVHNVEFDVAEVYVMPEKSMLEKKYKQIAWIKVHQVWLSRISENIQEILLILEKAEDRLSQNLEIA